MTFKDLKIGDTFDVNNVKYMKIKLVMYSFNPDEGITKVRNSVCIDEFSDRRGELKFFHKGQTISCMNWS